MKLPAQTFSLENYILTRLYVAYCNPPNPPYTPYIIFVSDQLCHFVFSAPVVVPRLRQYACQQVSLPGGGECPAAGAYQAHDYRKGIAYLTVKSRVREQLRRTRREHTLLLQGGATGVSRRVFSLLSRPPRSTRNVQARLSRSLRRSS